MMFLLRWKMKGNQVRLAKLEGALTPKQAFLLWMEEAHQFQTMVDYALSIKGGPESSWPLVRLPEQVATAVEQSMKGESKELIRRQVRQAVRDVVFLFHLHQRLNYAFLEQERYFFAQGLALATGMNAMIRELNLVAKGSGKAVKREDPSLPNRVRRWRVMAEDYLGELYSLRQASNSIDRHYFDGPTGLFSGSSQALAQLVEQAEDLVDLYNRNLAVPESEVTAKVDLSQLLESAQGAATKKAAYLVGAAKAEALDAMGENQASIQLMERYI